MNANNIKKLDIQPEAGVLGVFSRLNYKPWYALAEFVDNSTQSFYDNEEKLSAHAINKLKVSINYDFENNTLTIIDNAYGMSYNDFCCAVKLDSVPEKRNGRNEFGMGLKTAASWFGNVWSIESTELDSGKKFFTEIDIPKIRKNKTNFVNIKTSNCDRNEHGTVLLIKDLTKTIDASRTKGKIISLLSSMYRRDLNSGKVEIYFNDELLKFEDYKPLTFRDKTWKKDINFNFNFSEKEYNVNGFVGILKDGGFGKAGFSLFRRGRVVIGGEDQNFKPDRIFGQAQSPIAHKLYGEINLEDFEIHQAKDGFVWENGLKEEFVEELRENIFEYIQIARLTNKQRAEENEYSNETSEKVHDEVQRSIENIFNSKNESIDTCDETDVSIYKKEFIDSQYNSLEDKEVSARRFYKIPLNNLSTKELSVVWSVGNKDYWFKQEDLENEVTEITININHPFFKPYSKQEEFKSVIEKLVIAFVWAEVEAKKTANAEGFVLPSKIRNEINKILSKMENN